MIRIEMEASVRMKDDFPTRFFFFYFFRVCIPFHSFMWWASSLLSTPVSFYPQTRALARKHKKTLEKSSLLRCTAWLAHCSTYTCAHLPSLSLEMCIIILCLQVVLQLANPIIRDQVSFFVSFSRYAPLFVVVLCNKERIYKNKYRQCFLSSSVAFGDTFKTSQYNRRNNVYSQQTGG